VSTLHTRCPRCATVFRAGEDQLAAAGGRVRCGSCDEIFDAHAHAFVPGPPDSPPPGLLNADYIDELLRETPADSPLTQSELQLPQPQPQPQQPIAPVALPPLAALPVEIGAHLPRSWTRRRIAGLTGVAALLLALLALSAWLNRDRITQDPQWRTPLEQLCSRLGCTLPPYSDPARITSTELLVRPDPARMGVLLVDTVLHNGAPFAQRYPGLELSFTDIRGKAVARRLFKPHEYLGAHPQPGALLAPREPVRVHLELKDPGEHATNYELRLRELEQDQGADTDGEP
jgi:predicted Zn finger-like uncharacterized protein